jgi:hypothetical protein
MVSIFVVVRCEFCCCCLAWFVAAVDAAAAAAAIVAVLGAQMQRFGRRQRREADSDVVLGADAEEGVEV